MCAAGCAGIATWSATFLSVLHALSYILPQSYARSVTRSLVLNTNTGHTPHTHTAHAHTHTFHLPELLHSLWISSRLLRSLFQPLLLELAPSLTIISTHRSADRRREAQRCIYLLSNCSFDDLFPLSLPFRFYTQIPLHRVIERKRKRRTECSVLG